MDIVVQPNIHTYKSAFFMISDIKEKITPETAEVLISILCSCFGISIYGIAIHFIYRYFALERQGKLKYFNGKYLILWFLVPLTAGFVWFSITILLLPADQEKNEYLRETVKQFFDFDMKDTMYTGAVFHLPDSSTGGYRINWNSFYGFFGYFVVMTIPFNVIMVAGYKSWKQVKDVRAYGESEYSRSIQIQLYKALIAQTAIPVFLLFLPFGFLFVSPIFELNCQFLSAPCTFLYAIYPAIDPLPIFFFVEDYRRGVTGV
ncbi:hypothetical protein GCK72_013212 [Caenorhabditis remanei]|uniref:Seven TM Receptor n=1 Tax=Caenorhabditis remanei TaxID=31234 RepID=A0A6A5GN01_CAERE|nr:hypothetical protein GCK72_013212 [Caenorhabditis remanei]KAF1756758.1 hypothetical protein GCK72_013212 [Caenorhabditis remanei]